ncbi:MAG TPA: hypothetical protein VF665_09185 [Longimicrobium sp.]|jgi:hypothetical protein|uniref:hypothetical protein n=1 Tax=Longimicrobium sp. TaxID=2029185 RepID=UPI002ED7DA83
MPVSREPQNDPGARPADAHTERRRYDRKIDCAPAARPPLRAAPDATRPSQDRSRDA